MEGNYLCPVKYCLEDRATLEVGSTEMMLKIALELFNRYNR